MSTGLFYAIDDAQAKVFAGLATREQWYAAAGTLQLNLAPTLDAEDSLQSWEYALRRAPDPMGRLLRGDIKTPYDESDDPEVAFLSAASVATIADELSSRPPEFFAQILAEAHDGFTGDLWLHEPMRDFFVAAARNGQAIVVLWGG